MKLIPLTQGYVALVDDADFEAVNQFKWCAYILRHKDDSLKNVYAERKFHVSKGKRKTQSMHRFILGLTNPDIHVDHAPDPSGLNNQRHNLRTATRNQNNRNQRLRTNNTSGFKGVNWNKRKQKWRAMIEVQGVQHFLGDFATPKSAAEAYDIAALKLHGEFAKTNEMLGLL